MNENNFSICKLEAILCNKQLNKNCHLWDLNHSKPWLVEGQQDLNHERMSFVSVYNYDSFMTFSVVLHRHDTDFKDWQKINVEQVKLQIIK